MTHALSLENLTKTYRNGFQALKGVRLTVEQGIEIALLGPNGAGKSTTIGIICSLVTKTSGRVRIFDYDIDQDFNGKADQYRWLGTAGVRWGVDRDEDGELDRWKQISAEEVSAEIVRALADRDAERFARVLISDTEIEQLGLGAQQKTDLLKKTAAAKTGFSNLARRQKVITPRTRWVSGRGLH